MFNLRQDGGVRMLETLPKVAPQQHVLSYRTLFFSPAPQDPENFELELVAEQYEQEDWR